MYTGFYQLRTDFISVLQEGARRKAAERGETILSAHQDGKVLSAVLATLIEHGFQAFATLDAVVRPFSFFEENFIILDDNGDEGLYQGKFLIRTQNPDDQMNVWFGFLQSNWLMEPFAGILKEIRNKTGGWIDFYSILKSTDLVTAKTLSEKQADRYEDDPDRVDLVIRFKDISSIYDLLHSPQLDMVDLMFKNLLQIYGNQNHMFKLGSITRNLQMALSS